MPNGYEAEQRVVSMADIPEADLESLSGEEREMFGKIMEKERISEDERIKFEEMLGQSEPLRILLEKYFSAE